MPKEEKKSEQRKEIEQLVASIPHHSFEIQESKISDTIFLKAPWGDEAIALIAHKDGSTKTSLFEVLKKVALPREFSAIYHIDKNELEVIWTAYKLPDEDKEITIRKFDFKLGKKSFNCRFAKSSKELLEIASCAAFLKLSDTRFRNLQSIKAFTDEKAKNDEKIGPRLGEPVSFYISKIGQDAAEIINVVRHLNFFLRYYDDRSPYIIIHDFEEKSKYPTIRYKEDKFPSKITTRELNPILLSFWLATYEQEVTTRFLLCYRILEFVSGSYLQAQQRQDLLKILSSPTVLDSLDNTLDRVTEVVRQDKLSEFDRFERMFIDLVDKQQIWREACENADFFLCQTSFDGGLKVEPLITDAKSADGFDNNRMKAFAASLRKIRNALAHGGEQQAGNLILPTSRNLDLLIPWTHLASAAAAEALLYEHLG